MEPYASYLHCEIRALMLHAYVHRLLIICRLCTSSHFLPDSHLNSCSISGTGVSVMWNAMVLALQYFARCSHCWHCSCKCRSSSLTTTLFPQSSASCACSGSLACRVSSKCLPTSTVLLPASLALCKAHQVHIWMGGRCHGQHRRDTLTPQWQS